MTGQKYVSPGSYSDFCSCLKPEFQMGQQNDKACEDIYSEIVGERKRNDIKLLDSIPAADFFVYLDIKQEFLFHGSNQLDLDILIPGIKEIFGEKK